MPPLLKRQSVQEPLLLIAATTMAWIIVLVLFFQVLAATLAWAAIRLGWDGLTLPPGMLTGGKTMAYVLAGAAAFSTSLLIWIKYNRHRYYRRDRRQPADFSAGAFLLPWSEAYLDLIKTQAPAAPEPPLYLIKFKPPPLNLPGLISGSPKKILSVAAVLNRKRHFGKAAGLARLILAHPEAIIGLAAVLALAAFFFGFTARTDRISLDGDGCIVLLYHKLAAPNSSSGQEDPWTVSVADFIRQLQYLKEQGIHFITAEELEHLVAGKEKGRG